MLAQRIFLNYVESFPTLIGFVCLSSAYFPFWSMIGAWTVFVARIIYAIGYKFKPQARVWGALIMLVANLTLLIMSVLSTFYLIEAKTQN